MRSGAEEVSPRGIVFAQSPLNGSGEGAAVEVPRHGNADGSGFRDGDFELGVSNAHVENEGEGLHETSTLIHMRQTSSE